MLLTRYFDQFELHRQGALVALHFLIPHLALSTGRVNGGFAEGVTLVFNHQCCEPAGHWVPGLELLDQNPAAYQAKLLDTYGWGQETATGMATAASMRNLGLCQRQFRASALVAIATAGVDGNAARIGEPAAVYEHQGQFELLEAQERPPAADTINLILAFNQPLEPGTLVRAAMMATEAKCAVLQELSIPSRHIPVLATGTGTDQMVLVAPLDGGAPLTAAGHHTVLGELIGGAVQQAIREALSWQNHLTPVRQGSVERLLGRFGLAPGQLMNRVATWLPPDAAALAMANGEVIERDPQTVAAVAALIHVYDQVRWGLIPANCWRECAVTLAAQVAVAAGRALRWPAYHDVLSLFLSDPINGDGPATLVPRALALGYPDKWQVVSY